MLNQEVKLMTLLFSRVTLYTTEPNCTQPSKLQSSPDSNLTPLAAFFTFFAERRGVRFKSGLVADKMAVCERVDSAPKQAEFVHLNVLQEQSLSKHCFQWW